MGLLRKVLAGGPSHRSRLHTEKGQLIDPGGLAYLPAAAATCALRVATGYRPTVPWLGYRAIRRLRRLIRPDWAVVEFGSGMSTLWFAGRAGRVVSVEDNADWHAKVRGQIGRRGLTNVDYRHRPLADYPGVADLPDGAFDFALVDGSRRPECAAESVRLVKPGGYIYLDNSDKFAAAPAGAAAADPTGDVRLAESSLRAAAAGGSVEYFVDLIPTYIVVTEGMLIRLPGGRTVEQS